MKGQRKYLLLLFIQLTILSISFCQKPFQIHQIDAFSTPKELHLEGNLRTHEAYYSSSNSITGALFGFIIGPILFFMAFACVWFNEKRAAIDARRLKLAEQICVEVNPLRRDEITAAHMKLTHISGNSTTNEVVRDALSNIVANGAIKMQRAVEVMEWRATTNERNGVREVNYHLGWQSQNQPSAQGRSNPQTNWFVKTETIYNQRVFVGEYLLSKSQEDQCKKSNSINVDMNNANMIASNTQRSVRPVIQDGYIYFPSPNSMSISDHGALRIKYTYCPIGPITLMAKTVQNSFEPFPIAQYEGNGKIEKNELPACCCISNCIADLLKPIEEIDLVEEEIMSRSDIVAKAVEKSKILTWVLRVVSYLMMVCGICLFFSPITAMLGFIPLVGGILKGTVGFVIFLAALLVCIPFWIIAFSLAWLWYHPKVGAIFLGVGLLILGAILFFNYSRKGNVQEAAATAQTVKHLMRSWMA